MVEGALAHHQLEGQHAQAPQVDGDAVLLALEQLRGRVVDGAAQGLAAVVAVGRPP